MGKPVVLAEMDATWVSPYRPGHGRPQCQWPGLHPTDQRWSPSSGVGGGGGEVTRGLPPIQWTTSTIPGLHRALGMGDDMFKERKKGSVAGLGNATSKNCQDPEERYL